jgi:hypothetical protein
MRLANAVSTIESTGASPVEPAIALSGLRCLDHGNHSILR